MATSIKSTLKNIPSFELNNKYLFIHKEAIIHSNFGLDHTNELIQGGFGLYSSAKVRERIGPLRSLFYRIGFCRKGSVEVDCGLETFTHGPGTIHFNFPGQLFSQRKKSADMHSYYILFDQAFAEKVLPVFKIEGQYPFLDYAGVPFFQLSPSEAKKMESLFFLIDKEIKEGHADMGRAIRLLLELILLEARRSYNRQGLSAADHTQNPLSLVIRYKKMVAQHFRKIRSVKTYAVKLTVSSKHLSKVIKEQTGKNASDFIDEVLMLEVKALLAHTTLSISEIAYELDFTDPSHLTKFFKKNMSMTPQAYRRQGV